MRAKFELTEAQYSTLCAACVPCLPYIGPDGAHKLRPNMLAVNAAWIALGDELGFDAGTVMPITEKTFTAEVISPAASAD